MKKWTAVVLLFPCLLFFQCKKKPEQQGDGQQQVKEYAVITVQPQREVLKNSYPATIKGRQDIEIRPKIAGFITQLLVDEGSVVKKGQVLFTLDPVEYQAAVIAAEANVNVVETQVETSRLTLEKKRELRRKNIISEFELQTAQNEYDSQQAYLSQANAQLLSARNNLSYTRVVSPADGVVGTIPYRVGSLVSSSITEPLTIVSDISEMYIYFSMTEKQLLDLTRQSGSIQTLLNAMPQVELQLADGSSYDVKGKVETLSGVIDESTGAVTMRATFPNPRRALRSGGSGVVLIPHVIDQALLIPQKATYELQDKKFVYLLADSSKVKSTEIDVYPLDDGKNYVVTKGIRAGDRVVVEGVANLKDGMPIKPITPEESAARIQQMAKQPQDGQPPVPTAAPDATTPSTSQGSQTEPEQPKHSQP